jgi:UDP-N-acetylmuramyl tripeptide synthase
MALSPSSRLAIIPSKITLNLTRLFKTGGSALPGLIAQNLSPHILKELSQSCPEGVVLVAGTNGKTTTSRLLADMLVRSGKNIIYNRSGSNLVRGHISAFLEHTNWKGTVTADMAILEVDEAVLPAAIEACSPRLVVLNNLFRDQLDRYGEVDSIAKRWSEALRKHLPKKSLLLANGDDPIITNAVLQTKHTHNLFYGLFDSRVGTKTPSSAVDAYISPVSQKPLTYTTYYLSHLGEYKDPASQFARPSLDYAAHDIRLGNPSRFILKSESGSLDIELALPGLYNVYNGVAAAAAASALKLEPAVIADSLLNFQGAFGRFERLTLKNTEAIFALIKNPVGASEVMRTITQDSDAFDLAIIANDNFADGLDVSWYWDANFEQLMSRPCQITFAGSRAADMALRCKYAGFTGKCVIAPTIEAALDEVVESTSLRTYVMATYTATLAIQKTLARRNLKSSHWKE